MSGVSGLTGLARQYGQFNATPQATPEKRSGDHADPRHGVAPDTPPYTWQSQLTQAGGHGPYGLENQLLGDPEWVWQPAGDESQDPTFDHTPSRRAGPFPKGILSGPVGSPGPEDVSYGRMESMRVHGTNTGAALRGQQFPQGNIQNDEWVEIWETNPGSTDLSALPKQAMSSGYIWGTTDRRQSMARQNEYGFDEKHQHRRYAAGSVPGNTMYLKPAGRPLTKSLPGPARPAIGANSPFEGDDLGMAFDYNGAILQNVPTEYVAPPTPNLGAPIANPESVDSGDVAWY